MAKTLAELKAENEAEEAALKAAESEENAETEEDESEAEQEAESETESEEEAAESETGEDDEESTGDEEVEDWKQGDSHESHGEKKFTDGDVGKAKAKLRAKLERQHTEETEKLRLENERLQQQLQASGRNIEKPKREDFTDEYGDVDEEAYQVALTDHRIDVRNAETQAATQSQQQKEKAAEYERQVNEQVDQHYERAAKLAEKSGISAEAYQAADRNFRQVVEDVFPEAGDTIADTLIANLGEGSEKVAFSIGVNSVKREQLKKLLLQDKTGLKAAIYLGQLNGEIAASSKKKTNAPRPAPDLSGDKKQSSGQRALAKKYKEAHAKGKTQDAFNIKRQAKAAGVDTSNW